MTSIQKNHFPLIIKYIGVSFITWAISHWFFSWERALMTGLLWIIFFVVWTLLGRDTSKEDNFLKTTIFSALLAVSIWALTGWLQHFPDSPERSLYIVPLGFLFSVYFYGIIENYDVWKRKNILYVFIWWMISIIISLVFYWIVANWYIKWDTSHHVESSIHSEVQNWIDFSSQSGFTEIDKTSDTTEHIDWDGHHD
jgi:FtsH-binding integral membrane protein